MGASVWSPQEAGIPVADPEGLRSTQEFTASAGQTTFTITNFLYTPGTNALEVYINGVKQPQSTYTETSESSFTLDNPTEQGDFVEVVANVAFTQAALEEFQATLEDAIAGTEAAKVAAQEAAAVSQAQASIATTQANNAAASAASAAASLAALGTTHTTTATNITLANRETCIVQAADLTILLPAAPTAGYSATLIFDVAGVSNTTVGGNGSVVMGDTSFLVDEEVIALTFQYQNVTDGWRIV